MTEAPTPAWLVEREPGLCPCRPVGRRRRAGFAERTLATVTTTLHRALASDDTSALPGALQRLDPRAKVVSALLLLLAAGLVHHVVVLATLAAGATALAGLSRVSLRSFATRVWTFAPLFTALVVLPATLNVVNPGDVVVSFGHWWFGGEIGLTRQGLYGAALVVLRVGASVSLVVLLTTTTRWSRLLGALRSLFVPPVFVTVLAMAHRYLFVLLGTVTDMFTARRARVVRDRNDRAGRAFVVASAGALFGKAHALSEEVDQAMTARGYRGEGVVLDPPRLAARDVACVVAAVLLATLTIGVDRALRG
jgi:cobalt ECF transporter T component CbiQ